MLDNVSKALAEIKRPPPPAPGECFRDLTYSQVGWLVLNCLQMVPHELQYPNDASAEVKQQTADRIGRIVCMAAWSRRRPDDLQEIRHYAGVVWRVDDVVTVAEQLGKSFSREQAQLWLEDNQKYIRDRLIELGHGVIEDLLPEDLPDLPAEPEDEDDDDGKQTRKQAVTDEGDAAAAAGHGRGLADGGDAGTGSDVPAEPDAAGPARAG